MATPTVEQVMQAIETALTGISGLHVDDTAPGSINPPQAIVGIPPIPRYHTSLGGRRMELAPTVTVLVSAVADRAGQLALAAYADPQSATSVAKVLEADPTLGGVVSACQVQSFRPLGLEEVAAVGYFGGEFVLRVLT